MNKQEFLAELRKGLSGIPQEDMEERLNFYSEMIDDRVEEGLTEEQAVAEIGTVDEVVAQTVAQTPLTKLVKEKVRRNRSLKAWEIVLLILGAPVWLPLLIAAAAVIFSLYITLWSLIVSAWAVFISFVGSAVGCVAGGVIFLCTGYGLTGIAAIGAGTFCAGLAIFLFFGCLAATTGTAKLTKSIVLGIKNRIVKKEEA